MSISLKKSLFVMCPRSPIIRQLCLRS